MQAANPTVLFPDEIAHTGFDDCSTPSVGLTEEKTSEVFAKGFKSSDDFGHVKTLKPRGTFYPSTIEQICTIVNYARTNDIPLTCRGKAHSTFGQAQAEGGIVLNLRNFCAISSPQADRITVQSGARWKQVVEATLAKELTPPVLTDYLGLSVGGVLSVGGLGGQALHHGTVADNILELKVVTMDGTVTTCSKVIHKELFDASLTTLGQFTIILEATIRLVAAPKNCYSYLLRYDTLETYLEAQRHLLKTKTCDYLEGFVRHFDAPFAIEAVVYDKPLDFQDLQATDIKAEVISYQKFIHRLKTGITFFKQNGSWRGAHPWINLFLRDDGVQSLVSEWIKASNLTKETGNWPILLYPMNREKLTCPYFQVPQTETIWVFDILRYADSPESAQELIKKNRVLYDIARQSGATMYPVGSIPLEESDWANHYGDKWAPFRALKEKHDPSHLLGRGQAVFKRNLV